MARGPGKNKRPPAERFAAFCDAVSAPPHVLWKGGGEKQLAFYDGGTVMRPQRYAWFLAYGELPQRLRVTCGEWRCVAVEHLRPSAIDQCPNGHSYDGSEGHNAYGHRRCRVCVRERQKEQRVRTKVRLANALPSR